jgi:hypothetical protein
VAKIGQIGGRLFCHTLAMTTKTIPAYLEDERQKGRDAQLRMEQEAARIEPLNHGHHRTAKQPKMGLPSAFETVPKVRRTVTAAGKKPRTARKKAPKAHKAA